MPVSRGDSMNIHAFGQGESCVSELDHNIPQHSVSESALRQERQFTDAVLAAMPGVFYVLGRNGRIVRWNKNLEDLTGRSGDELRSVRAIDLVHPNDRERTKRIVHGVLDRGNACLETRLLSRTGEGVLPLITSQRLTLGGEPAFAGFGIDITERHSLDEALRASEQRLRRMVDSNMVGVVIWDLEGNIRDANDCFLDSVGYSREDLREGLIHWREMTPPKWNEVDAEAVHDLLEKGVCAPFEKEYYRKDGSTVPVIIACARFDGTDEGVAFVLDITAQKLTEERLRDALNELKRSNAELEQFAYVASHDLQEPLRMVASFTQLLRERYEGKLDPDADDFINYAFDGARRMQKLIQGLLQFSRVGTQGVQFAPVDIGAVVDRALQDLNATISERGAVITRDDCPSVFADESQLGRVFQNLIVNAIKFCGEKKPEIHIGAKHDGAGWVFSVSDNGPGIEPQYFERIFLIFQVLDRSDRGSGTGMGLAICKRVVERHGGRIWVESDAGKGATFSFSIPDRRVAR